MQNAKTSSTRYRHRRRFASLHHHAELDDTAERSQDGKVSRDADLRSRSEAVKQMLTQIACHESPERKNVQQIIRQAEQVIAFIEQAQCALDAANDFIQATRADCDRVRSSLIMPRKALAELS